MTTHSDPHKRITELLTSCGPNWDRQGARQVDVRLGATARFIVNVMLKMGEDKPEAIPAITPLRNGGLQLEWHANGVDSYLTLLPDGTCGLQIRDPNSIDGTLEITS